jgi:hypothetical protein
MNILAMLCPTVSMWGEAAGSSATYPFRKNTRTKAARVFFFSDSDVHAYEQAEVRRQTSEIRTQVLASELCPLTSDF